MRKLTNEYFVKQILKSKTPSEFVKAGSAIVLFWVSSWSYQAQKAAEMYK